MKFKDAEFENADSFLLSPLPGNTPDAWYANPFYKGRRITTMQAFNTPSHDYWRGFIIGLRRAGYSNEAISELLSSKYMRHMFDKHDETLTDLGYKMARAFVRENEESVNVFLTEEAGIVL